MRYHFYSLVSRSIHSFLVGQGTSGLGFFSPFVVAFISAVLVTAILLLKRGKGVVLAHLKRNAFIVIAGAVLGNMLWYVPIFTWSVIRTTYQDHQDLVGEKVKLQGQLKEKEQRIKQLESSTIHPTTPGTSKVSAPPSIMSLTVEVRMTCKLRDPNRLPQDTHMITKDKQSYLEGALGKSYLDMVPLVSYKRLEEEGSALVVQHYILPPNSALLSEPIEKVNRYETLSLDLYGIKGADFEQCKFIELTMRVNGSDVLKYQGQFNAAVLPEKHLVADLDLKKLRASK